MDKFKSCGFPKGYSAQHCLLAILVKQKRAADQGKVLGALLTDLSKAFKCLPHELIIAKLNAQGFNLTALKLMNDYLFERRQRSKIHNSYSTREDMLFVGRQGSILESIIFNNMFLSNLFFIFNDNEFMLLCR